MSFVPPFLRGTYSFSLRSKDNRDSAPNLTGMLPPAKAQERPKIVEAVPEPLGPAQPDAKTVLEMLNHAAEALDYLQTRCRELEASADERRPGPARAWPMPSAPRPSGNSGRVRAKRRSRNSRLGWRMPTRPPWSCGRG